jgi:chromosomal replication initiator protein
VLRDVVELWNQTVSYLEQRGTTENSQIGIYLNYLTPETLSETELVVSTDNSFAKTWIERNYFPAVKDAIFNVAGIDFGFRIVVSEKKGAQAAVVMTQTGNTLSQQSQQPSVNASFEQRVGGLTSAALTAPSYLGAPTAAPAFSTAGVMGVSPVTGTPGLPFSTGGEFGELVDEQPIILSDARTFESFIVGDSNRFAFSTSLGVAKSPGTMYNPLFLYGGSGLGKTHLLLAIENYIRSHQPQLRVTYAQTSDFVNDFTAMFRDNEKRREFAQKYHSADVILLDDVQQLENKVETTNEVFQIFNHFIAQNKQIVLSSDRAPNDIDLDARYKSRFASGITIDIQPPNFETKLAIFENYLDYCCRKIGLPNIKEMITRDIADRIIDLSSDNIRELEGATASLVAYLSARQNKFDTLTIEEVEQRISNVFMRSEQKRIDINTIQKEIELFYKISHEDLVGKKRSQGISYPRQVAMYLSRSMTGESFPDIGRAFGGKDHTSVMYAYNRIEQKRQLSKETEREIVSLVSRIRE